MRACLVLLLAVVSFNATAATAAAVLTVGDCVRRALERGYDLQIERLTLGIARDVVADARSAFDPRISAAATRNVSRTAAGTALSRTRSDGVNTSVGVSQLLPFGASLGLNARLDRSEFDAALAALDPAYSSGVTLTLTQPLLRDRGAQATLNPLRRAQRGAESAAYSYHARALDVIQTTEGAYFELVAAREELEVRTTSLSLAQRLLEEATSRHQSGVATRLDVLQAEVGIANARRAVLEARNALSAAEDALVALIGPFEFGMALGVATMPSLEERPAPHIESSYALALEHQPDLLAARAAVDVSRLAVESAQDDLKPSLDLELTFGLTGDDAASMDAVSRAFEAQSNAWQAGLSMTYPLGRRGEKARFRQAAAALRREELRIEQLEQDILVSIRDAVRDVETSRDGVQIAALGAELAQQQHEAEINRYRAGLSTSRRVLEAQADLETAQLAHLQAKLSLQRAASALRRIEGSAPDHYGVSILPAPVP